jgi:ribosomal-protein-alanine N-acetyltransferase
MGKILLPEPLIRPAARPDLAALMRIQRASAGAAQWASEGVTRCIVAEVGGYVAGFLAYQQLAGEVEVMNLAVDPPQRRRGVGRALLNFLLGQTIGDVFLEVRAGNASAQRFYEEAGFREVGRRAAYYRNPPEDAIVMRRGPVKIKWDPGRGT